MTVVEQELSKTAQWMESMIPQVIEFVLQIVLAFVVIIIGMKVIKWVRKILRKGLEKQQADTGLVQFLDSLVKYGLYLLLALSILSHFGVQTTSIVAAIGSVGVAIGLQTGVVGRKSQNLVKLVHCMLAILSRRCGFGRKKQTARRQSVIV